MRASRCARTVRDAAGARETERGAGRKYVVHVPTVRSLLESMNSISGPRAIVLSSSFFIGRGRPGSTRPRNSSGAPARLRTAAGSHCPRSGYT
eukprot:ctg_2334.g354